jgi:hypothetical protein
MSPGSGRGERVIPAIGTRGRHTRVALQDLSLGQAIDSTNKKTNLPSPPLREILSAQPAVLIGLIAHITGTPQQSVPPTVCSGKLRMTPSVVLAFSPRRLLILCGAVAPAYGRCRSNGSTKVVLRGQVRWMPMAADGLRRYFRPGGGVSDRHDRFWMQGNLV